MDKSLSKPIKYAVFYAIINEKDKDKIIAIKRPEDDEDLPNIWGLPAGSVRGGESFEQACLRQAKNKLGIDIKILKFIGRGNIDRGDYILHGEEYLVKFISGDINLNQKDVEGTKYVDWKWALPEDFREASSKGSLCSSIYLDSLGIGSEIKFSK